jgi:hypothetical protein
LLAPTVARGRLGVNRLRKVVYNVRREDCLAAGKS